MAIIFLFPACTSTNLDENYSNSSTVAFNLLKVCVDKTLSEYPNINTKNYVLDLSEISTLNKEGIEKFLKAKNSTLPTTHDDSVIIFENQDWSKSHMNKACS